MKNKINWIDKYLTNNGMFDKSDIFYRKVYLLNAMLTIMLITCLFFAIVDIFIFKTKIVAIGNAVSVSLSLLTLLYLKKTNKYKPAAYFAVAILVIFLAFYFQLVQNEHYAFYWLAILPPVVFFLLERKAARIILDLFGSYMLYFILSNKMSWSPTTFDWAYEFDDYIYESIIKRNHDNILKFNEQGNIARLAVPTPDHFYPLLYALGASDKDDKISVFNKSCELGSLSMTAYLWE